MDRPKAFFASLFDFSFETFITAKIVKILYGLSIAAGGLFALFQIVNGFLTSAGMGLLMLLIGGPLLFLVSVIYARVLLEIILVIFRISEDCSKLVEIGNRAPATPPAPPPSAAGSEPSGPQWGTKTE